MQKEVVEDGCPTGWWTNLLYINNFYTGPQENPSQRCLGFTWYLANDMQFYILSPIVLIALLLYKLLIFEYLYVNISKNCFFYEYE